MPRTYVPTRIKQYSAKDLENALDDVHNGRKTVPEASDTYKHFATFVPRKFH